MKAKVDEPPQPKLKLNMSGAALTPAPKQQLKLKLRQSPVSGSNTPATRDSATPGVIVDSEALQRQQRHVTDSMGGRRSRPADKAATPVASNPFSSTRGSSTTIVPIPAAQTRTAGSPSISNGVKQDVQSPALSAIRPGSNAPESQQSSVPALPVMAPPQSIARPASGSPHPNGLFTQQNGLPTPGFQPPTPYIPPSIPRTDVFRKTPLKSKLLPTTLGSPTNIFRIERSPHSQPDAQHSPRPQPSPPLDHVHSRKQNQDTPQCHCRHLTHALVPADHAQGTHRSDESSLPSVCYGKWQQNLRSQPSARYRGHQRRGGGRRV